MFVNMAFSKLLTRMTRAHVYPTQITRWPLCNLSFAVDPVDSAIRHENGKQVASSNFFYLIKFFAFFNQFLLHKFDRICFFFCSRSSRPSHPSWKWQTSGAVERGSRLRNGNCRFLPRPSTPTWPRPTPCNY